MYKYLKIYHNIIKNIQEIIEYHFLYLLTFNTSMQLFTGEARDLDTPGVFDVICLDPMFPTRSKSAAVKKGMALFQRLLEGAGSDDGGELLQWALEQDVARVVVKRPPRAPALAAGEPSHSISGKAVRYDVYVHRKLG